VRQYETPPNIFATSDDPKKCAESLDDIRLRRCIDKTGRILARAAHRLYGQDKLYDDVYAMHPINLWIRRADENFLWTAQHFIALNNEFHVRFASNHNARLVLDSILRSLRTISRRCKDQGVELPKVPTCFENCTVDKANGISFKHLIDTHEAYRQYLNNRWSDQKDLSWTQREPPSWLEKK
jgi:hypothetical protein